VCYGVCKAYSTIKKASKLGATQSCQILLHRTHLLRRATRDLSSRTFANGTVGKVLDKIASCSPPGATVTSIPRNKISYWVSSCMRSGQKRGRGQVYIVEVGTGHGRLTYHVLRALVSMRDAWPEPARATADIGSSEPLRKQAPFVWVATDFSSSNIGFLR